MLTIILSEQEKYAQIIELKNESWKKCDCKLFRRFHSNQHRPIKKPDDIRYEFIFRKWLNHSIYDF